MIIVSYRGGVVGLRMQVAINFIRATENPVFAGNTDNAAKFAEHFAIGMSSRNQITHSPSSPIRTYCFMQKDSFVILTHLSAMTHSTESKKSELEEYAWALANDYASLKHPDLKKRAVCFMNDWEYLVLLIGEDSKKVGRFAPVTDLDSILVSEKLSLFFQE